jgi:hypothetical protein
VRHRVGADPHCPPGEPGPGRQRVQRRRGVGKGLAKAVVAAAARALLAEGRAVLYLHHEDKLASARVAEAVGLTELGRLATVVPARSQPDPTVPPLTESRHDRAKIGHTTTVVSRPLTPRFSWADVMGRSALRTYLAASAAVMLATLLIPSENVKGALFVLVKLAVAIVLCLAVRLHRPRLVLPWLLLAAAQLIALLADVAMGIAWVQGTTDSSPSVADALYMIGFVPLIAGLALLYRGGAPAGGHRPSRIDAAVVTISIGLLCWVVLIGPTLDNRSLPPLAKAVTLAYPIGDLVIVALVASMLLGAWVHTRSQVLLLTAVIGSLLADVLNAVNTLHGGGITFFGLLDVLWMTSSLLLGAAALHPSMRLIGDVSDRTVKLSRSRVVVLAAASLIAVGVVAV